MATLVCSCNDDAQVLVPLIDPSTSPNRSFLDSQASRSNFYFCVAPSCSARTISFCVEDVLEVLV